ncbi:hypothetical protein NNO04_14935 [Citrobacter sp. Awk 4]|uniref:hypothetical protein n=1 Tax=Citrobacter sp. Awk 4 TaxID=2963955 RepID=UPI002303F2DF|nr:hypothetical protein [Citrobacter sp. Awk 4]MDA8479991.1 hypothetical protein [Citrobacter sp. Awk 4]
MERLHRFLPALLAGLLLATCLSDVAGAAGIGRPARPPHPVDSIRIETVFDTNNRQLTPKEREEATIHALQNRPNNPLFYSGPLAVAAYKSGHFSKDSARKIGQNKYIYAEWEKQERESDKPLGVEEWKQIIKNGLARSSAASEHKHALEIETLRAQAKEFAERTDKLPPQAISALQQASKGRTAALNEEMPGVVVKLADDPIYDRLIIEHIWARHAVALSTKVSKSHLNLINLFPDPVGDSIFSKIQNALGSKSSKTVRTSKILADILTGKQPFERERLLRELAQVQGQTFYVVSHIPEQQSGQGKLEFDDGNKPVTTSIASLQAIFQAAKVNLFIVGCSSSKHAAIGLSKDINNVDALTKFQEAIISEQPKNLFEWYAAFAADALVVIDPLASKVFGQDAAQHPLSEITLITGNKPISYGYAGTYALPPATPQIGTPPSVAMAVAAKKLIPPSACSFNPSPSQIEAAKRFAPAGISLLVLAMAMSIFLTLKEEIKKKGTEYLGATMMPIIIGAPILISIYAWLNKYATFAPGPWLGIWCLVYGALFTRHGITQIFKIRPRKLNASIVLAGILLTCSLLFSLSYFGFSANSSIHTFCTAFSSM